MEVAFAFLATAPSLYLNIIYKQLTLIAIYYLNFLVTIFNFYLIPAPYLINTIYEDKALKYNYP